MTTCLQCKEAPIARGLCEKHYQQARRAGELDNYPTTPRPPKDGNGPISLIALREAAGLTRADLAAKLGLAAPSGRVSVAQMESRDDWLLSRLAAYVSALEGSAELIVTVAGEEFRFEVTE